jgi:ribosomal protein L13E
VLFVTAAELKTLGIDAEQADAVQITIVDGRLQSQSVVATDEDV